MKSFLLLAAASAAAAASAQVPDCDIVKLAAILQSPPAVACMAETGYTVVSFRIPPVEQLRDVCKSASCTALFRDLTAAVPTECNLVGIAFKAFLDEFPPACAAALADPTATSKPTPAPTTTAVPTPSTTA